MQAHLSMEGLCRAANQSTNFEAAALQILARTAVRSPAAFDLGRQVAEKCIVAGNTALVTRTGWTFHNTSGVYQTPAGTDYLLRARKCSFTSCTFLADVHSCINMPDMYVALQVVLCF